MNEPLPEFARQIQREHGRADRVIELGLRAVHAELAERRSPERTITDRARQAQERRDHPRVVDAQRACDSRPARARGRTR